MLIGVLDIQGDVIEHIDMLESLGATTRRVKTPKDFENLDGLIIPGGESTTLSDLIHTYNLDKKIIQLAKANKPIFGTCAGAILLSQDAHCQKVRPLKLINVAVDRNGYGTQKDSFEKQIEINNLGPFHALFIRAPIIKEVAQDIEVLSELDNHPILIRQSNILLATFHPELTRDDRVHRLFLAMV